MQFFSGLQFCEWSCFLEKTLGQFLRIYSYSLQCSVIRSQHSIPARGITSILTWTFLKFKKHFMQTLLVFHVHGNSAGNATQPSATFMYMSNFLIFCLHISFTPSFFFFSVNIFGMWKDSPATMLPSIQELMSSGIQVWIYRQGIWTKLLLWKLLHN